MLVAEVTQVDIIIGKADLIREVHKIRIAVQDTLSYGVGFPFNEVSENGGQHINRLNKSMSSLKDDILNRIEQFEAEVVAWQPAERGH